MTDHIVQKDETAPDPGLVDLLIKVDSAISLGDFSTAETALREALELVPDELSLILALGRVLLAEGCYEEAQRVFIQALDLDVSCITAYAGLGSALVSQGRWQEAEMPLRQAYSLAPDDLEVLKLMGMLCIQRQNFGEGLIIYNRLLQMMPEDVEILMGLGSCHYQVARTCYERVLELTPDHPIAQENLAFLENQPLQASKPVAQAESAEPVINDFAVIDPSSLSPQSLPMPPLELRRIVGPTEDAHYENADGRLIFGDLAYGALKPGQAYRRVFDFGCGCGRTARQLLLQKLPPEKYVGVDISHELIDWSEANLGRPGVNFYHHDVWNPTYAPDNSRRDTAPIRNYGTDYSLIIAHSVFTHLLEDQSRFYLEEMVNMLADDGLIRCTWFLFNREWFPPLAPFQHCVYLQYEDPTQAVYYDWEFFLSLIKEVGLKIVDCRWSAVPGFQNAIVLGRGPVFTDISEGLEPGETVLGFGYSRPHNWLRRNNGS